MANLDSEFFGLVFPGLPALQATQKFTPKIHVQNCRHSSPISLSRTQNLFTAIFCLRGRPTFLSSHFLSLHFGFPNLARTGGIHFTFQMLRRNNLNSVGSYVFFLPPETCQKVAVWGPPSLGYNRRILRQDHSNTSKIHLTCPTEIDRISPKSS